MLPIINAIADVIKYVDTLPNKDVTFVLLKDSNSVDMSNMLLTVRVSKYNDSFTLTARDDLPFSFNLANSFSEILPDFYGISKYCTIIGCGVSPRLRIYPANITHNGKVYVLKNNNGFEKRTFDNVYYSVVPDNPTDIVSSSCQPTTATGREVLNVEQFYDSVLYLFFRWNQMNQTYIDDMDLSSNPYS